MARKQTRRLQHQAARDKHAHQCIALAIKACDQVAELTIALNAYLALERFVEPAYTDEEQASVQSSRGQLTSLLHAINADVQRRISALAEITTQLQAQAHIDAALALESPAN